MCLHENSLILQLPCSTRSDKNQKEPRVYDGCPVGAQLYFQFSRKRVIRKCVIRKRVIRKRVIVVSYERVVLTVSQSTNFSTRYSIKGMSVNTALLVPPVTSFEPTIKPVRLKETVLCQMLYLL